jgi:hypothetical protein
MEVTKRAKMKAKRTMTTKKKRQSIEVVVVVNKGSRCSSFEDIAIL